MREPGNDVDAKFFTREVFEGPSKATGWVQLTMCKYPACRLVLSLVANVPNSSDAVQKAKGDFMGSLASPRAYSDAFHRQATSLEPVAEDLEQDLDGVCFETTDFELSKLTENMPKCLVKFAEILYGLYAGTFDDEMKALAGEKNPRETLMDEGALGGVSPNFQAKLREGLRLVANQTHQFTGCQEQQELVSVRALKRDASNPDDAQVVQAKKERAHLWEKAREQRRRFVAVSQLKGATAPKIEAVVSKLPASKFGAANRLFVWSADLVTETTARPWKESSPTPKSTATDAVLDFMAKLAGPGDFVICFDGRMRSERANLEKKLESSGKSLDEMLITYAADTATKSGNKVFMGAKLHEIGYVLLPCKRQRMSVVERKDKFLPQGENSTHCSTFTNVPLPKVAALPRISTTEKAIVFPAGAEGDPPRAACPSKWDFGGVPMFWRESKSQDFWVAVLKMFNAKAIVDFTPGSGALASAAMSLGAKYTGFVEETKHLAWLQNIVDTAALKFIAGKEEVLYMEELAELISSHYQDILEDPEDVPDAEWLSEAEEEE